MSRKGTQVTTGKVRFNYVNIFKAKAIVEGQEPKYSMSILIPKSDTKTVAEIKEAIEEAKKYAVKEKWNGKVPANLRSPLRDGDEERGDDKNYVGHYFINSTSKNKPLIIDYDKQEIMDQSEVYGGCWGKIILNFFSYSRASNRGISAGLMGVMKTHDGEPLGGGRITASAFDDEEDDDFLD